MKRLLVCLLFFPACAFAQVEVKDAWVRATVPDQKISGAFMQLSASRDTRLVEVRTPVAGMVEIHEMAMDKGIMRMRPRAGIDLPAGRTVEFKPGGFHMMLMDLKRQLKEGESVPIILVLEGKDRKREAVEVKAQVRPLNTAAHGHQGH